MSSKPVLRGRTVVPRRSLVAFVVTLCCCWSAAPSALAAPGDLDLTFSGDGRLTTDFGFGGADQPLDLALQPDGKIIAVGSGGTFAESDFTLVRYNTDGSLDTSFSGDGNQATDFGGYDLATSVAVQPDGKIVVAGVAGGGDGFNSDFGVARYNPDGSLDTTFSGDGKQTTSFSDGYDPAQDVAVQSDGKIVAVGSGGSTFAGSISAVVRYNTDGSPDTSFSGDGKQTGDLQGFLTAVAVQGDGKLVVAAATGTYPNSEFALARYHADGSLDTSFSGDGTQTADLGGADQPRGLAIQSNGKIVAVGSTSSPTSNNEFGDFALARFNGDGSLDTSFSGDGKQTTDFGSEVDGADAVAIQSDGKLVVTGGAGSLDLALARYNADGALDTSFSGDGKLSTPDLGTGVGVAVQSDGKIVAAGAAGFTSTIARYNGDGSLDQSFSGDGMTRVFFSRDEAAAAVALQPDGKIVAVGSATGTGEGAGDFALTRYNPDGSLDTSFSGDGKQTTDFGGDFFNFQADAAGDVAIQADGRIVVVGAGDNDFKLARYHSDGSLDTSFSGDGKQTTDFGGLDGAQAVALAPGGKIVVAGLGDTSTADPSGDFALARYNADGSLDNSFSDDGRQTTDFGASGSARDVALQPDGKIVAAGGWGGGEIGSGGDFGLARYNADGSLDTGFSGDGKQTTDMGTEDDVAGGVVLQPDGRIVTAGKGGNFGDFALTRYTSNGELDPSFSDDGKQTTDFATSGEGARDLALQSNGKVVAVGSGDPGSPNGDNFALARYNLDGSLDSGFSGDGKQTTDFGFTDEASGIALGSGGEIVVAGTTAPDFDDRSSTGSDFALARYEGDNAASDNTAPQTTINSGPAGATNDPTPEFTFSSDEPGSTFECRVYQGAAPAGTFSPCSSPYTTSQLPDGQYTFEVRATDAAGNTDQTPASRSFSVDTTPVDQQQPRTSAPPDTAIEGRPAEWTRQRTPKFAFKSSTPRTTFECSLDGSPFTPCTSPFVTPRLDAGRHTFQVRARDSAGNVDPTPATFVFSVAATLADLPPPQVGRTFNVEPVGAGQVLVSEPPSAARARASASVPGIKGRNFVPLREARQIAVGSLLDTRKGGVRLVSARDAGGRTQTGEFGLGVFQVLQSRAGSSRGLTELRLKGASFARCRGAGRGGKKASSARNKRRIRRLRGNAKGRFRTRGRYSAATVRGTVWEVSDRCDGTLTKVTRGRVAVRDFRRRKTISLRTGKRYLARASG